MGRVATEVVLDEEEETTLQSWRRRTKMAGGLQLRARIILDCARGYSGQKIAQRQQVSEQTVSKWRKRFVANRIAGLSDLPRPGQPRKHDDEKVKEVLDATLHRMPKKATHWSLRSMSEEVGVPRDFVHRVWRAYGLKPHLVDDGFKLSNDPHFVEKVRDVVGLYINPPEKAIVLCVDEKSQIQALDRTQLSLPMSFGTMETRTHDYTRHGTTTLFAALDMKTGKVIGKLKRRHRAEEFISFLRHVDRQVPEDLQVHLILDNYSTHKTEKVKKWLLRHPRFHFHFIPTYSSWLNMVERFFSALTVQQLRRGTHRSTPALEQAIRDYLDNHNEDPTPYQWVKSPEEIFDKVVSLSMRINRTGH